MNNAWFPLDEDASRRLTEDQRRFLDEARRYLERLGSRGVAADGSHATVEPGQTTWGRNKWPGTLWLIVETGGPRSHDSLQLGMGPTGAIVGGWQDRHYEWDDHRAEAFRARTEDVGVAGAVASAMEWLGAEISILGQ